MLRGPQTPGELKGRSERLCRFEGLPAVQETLERLIEREFVVRQSRRPGQKEERYQQVLGGDGEAGSMVTPAVFPQHEPATGEAASAATTSEDRLDRIEHELEALRRELASLREALGESG
jgi:uncharacterized protein YceH (UPF0502 family)